MAAPVSFSRGLCGALIREMHRAISPPQLKQIAARKPGCHESDHRFLERGASNERGVEYRHKIHPPLFVRRGLGEQPGWPWQNADDTGFEQRGVVVYAPPGVCGAAVLW